MGQNLWPTGWGRWKGREAEKVKRRRSPKTSGGGGRRRGHCAEHEKHGQVRHAKGTGYWHWHGRTAARAKPELACCSWCVRICI